MTHKFGELAHLLAGQSVVSAAFDPNKVKDEKSDRYHTVMRGINMYSFSTSGVAKKCHRKLAIKKHELAKKYNSGESVNDTFFETNQDFVFGKCVETGVQGLFLRKTKEQIFFDMLLSWKLPLDAIHPKGYKKSFVDATIAIDQLAWIILNDPRLVGWQVAEFNNKPAIELAFCVDLENGYYYVGHVDIILFNPLEGRYKVIEIKTTEAKYLHPAKYKNSEQATGYSIILDSIATDAQATTTFEVFYLVFNSAKAAWEIFEFTKSRSYRAEWINTVILDIQQIDLYRKLNFWPKNGNSCFEWRPCEYFEICDLPFESFNPSGEFEVLEKEELDKHQFDFRFFLKDIIETQQELL